MKFFVSTIIVLGSVFFGFGQSVSGRVLDYQTGVPLENVTIVNTIGNQWALTDASGSFSITINGGAFELEFKLLGKETEIISHQEVDDRTNLTIRLKDHNLRLDEITVTAVPKRSKVGSAIILDDYAIDQVQAFSLADVLSQLPGQKMEAPTFTSAKTISLRTAVENRTNAFGVAFMLDGVRLSNDENMQMYNGSAVLTDFENANTGIDLRSIPAANIESIEVVSGIPDAEYGNLTTGLIKIERKAGVTPFRVRANINQGNTSVSVGKGLHINDTWGDLSLSFDFLNANSDPRNSLANFNRLTASAIWSTYNKSKNIKNTLSLTLHNNLDDVNYDKDLDDGGQNAEYRKDRGIQISNRFNWKPNSNLIDNFNFTLGYSYLYQHSYSQVFLNDGGKVLPTLLETGLASGEYTPVAYLQIKQTFGQPINFNSKISFDKTLGDNNAIKHNLSTGLTFNYSDNRGRGKAYDPSNAHTQITLQAGSGSQSTGAGMRALDYGRYVKPKIGFGVFFQDDMTWTLSNGRDLYSNIGFRYDLLNGFSSFSPRVNLGLEVMDNLSVRAGAGFASKAPSLSQIFPGDKYFDVLLRDFRTPDYSFNLVQTYKKEIGKLDIEPTKSWKYEIGANFNPSFGRFSITAFYNHTFDGITTYNNLERVQMPEIDYTFNDPNPPSYEVVGQTPFILDYSLNTNALDIVDKGLEFYLNFNKIKAINTLFGLMGSFVYSKSGNALEETKINQDPLEQEYLYGVYRREQVKQTKLDLRATVTHHIPEIGLLISLSAEQFTFSNLDKNSDIYPVAYLNPALEQIPIPIAQRSDNKFSGLWRNPNLSKETWTPLYHNFHLRVTKELLNGISMSMYVYNFLDHRPVIRIGDQYEEQNNLISFGANIQYQF